MSEKTNELMMKCLYKRIHEMSKWELEKALLISFNKIGTAVKGGEYADNTDATLHVCAAGDMVMKALDDVAAKIPLDVSNSIN